MKSVAAASATLLDAGVTSFKIEGRLKDVNYIRNVRGLLSAGRDQALPRAPGCGGSSVGESIPDFAPDPSKSFTRGESQFFFDGKRRRRVFRHAQVGRERIGRVAQVGPKGFRWSARPIWRPATASVSCGTASWSVPVSTPPRGPRVEPNRMDGHRAGDRNLPQLRHRFNKLLSASRMRRNTFTALVEVTASGHPAGFHRLRGPFSAEVGVRQKFAAAKNPDCQCGCCPLAGGTERRYDFRGRRGRGGRRGTLRSGVVGGRVAARGARKAVAARAARSPAVSYPARESRGPLSVAEGDRRGECDQPPCEAFYRGPRGAACRPPLELAPSFEGRCVMRSAYCIRREIGECLRERRAAGGPYIEARCAALPVEFDCAHCEMKLIAAEK